MSEDDEYKIHKVVPDDSPHVTDPEITDAAEKIVEAAFKKAKDERDSDIDLQGNLGPGTGREDEPTDDEIREGLEWIPEKFEEYLTPHPLDFDLDVISTPELVSDNFNFSGEAIQDSSLKAAFKVVSNKAGAWEGDLGENLMHYVNSLDTIMGNHGKVANMLHIEAQKMKELYKSRRQNAKDIADKTVEAIEAIKDSKGANVPVLLALIIAAGTFATLGSGTVALVGAAAIAGATLGGPFVPEDEKKEIPLGADNVRGVIDNMKNALADLDEAIKEQEDTLIEAMKDNEASIRPHISDDGKQTALLPMKPDLAGADVKTIKEDFFQFRDGEGGGGDDDGDGRGSYKGDDPPDPDEYDGAIDDTSDDK